MGKEKTEYHISFDRYIRFNVLVGVFSFLCFSLTSCKAEPQKKTSPKHERYASFMVSDSTYYNFGTLNGNKERVSHTFNIKNMSDSNVFINNVLNGCNCISSSFSSAPIRPNETAEITVSYTPGSRKGAFSKTIYAILNDGELYLTLTICGIS